MGSKHSDNSKNAADMPLQGCFTVIKDDNAPYDISVSVRPECVGTIPEEQQRLYADVESACTIIRNLSQTEDDIKNIYFEKLLGLAQVGLVGGEVSTASISLEHLKEEIVIGEGTRIKNRYMRKLGLYALILSAVMLGPLLLDILFFKTRALGCVALIAIGSFAGSFVSFGARKFQIEFEELAVPEKDMMKPLLRLIYTLVATLIFVLLLISGVIELKIGDFDSKNIIDMPTAALTIGAVCGLVESRIGISVYKKASSVIGE